MADPRSPARFEARDLADVLIPSSPVRLGDRVVYALRRNDLDAKRAFTALYAVPLSGGAPRRLTRGPSSERAPRADPLGRYVVFVSDRGAGEQLYRLESDGGEARALTDFPHGSIQDVVVSPDGARLAVTFQPGAPDDDALPLAANLARAPHGDGAPEWLPGAPHEPPSKPREKRGEPRARVYARLHFREDGAGYWPGHPTHLWVVDADTGEARRLTRGPRDHAMPSWSPDGRSLVVVTNLAADPDLDVGRNDLVLVDAASGAVRALSKPDGAALCPSVSPEGARVAYLYFRPDDPFGAQHPLLGVSPLAGDGGPAVLGASLDRPLLDLVLDDLTGAGLSPSPPLWSEDGTSLTVVASDRGSVRLCELSLSSGVEARWRTEPHRAVSAPSPLGGGSFAVLLGAKGAFTEVGVVERDGAVRALTTHHASLTERVAPREPELVTLTRDGVEVSGYYLAPRGIEPGRRAPGIVYVHGGPHVCYGERLFFEMQWFADQGYAVLYTNPRGSHSYGQEYASAIERQWGTPDDGDQLAFAEWLATRPEVDPARLGVAGGSYGGFMALHLAGTSERFRCVVAERGLYNWASNFGASDYGRIAHTVFGGLPWERAERYLEASSIRHVRGVRAPVLVVHSEGDLRTRDEQGVQLFNALKLGGVPTALLLFPEEGHGLSRGGRIDRRIERLRQLKGWFDAWL